MQKLSTNHHPVSYPYRLKQLSSAAFIITGIASAALGSLLLSTFYVTNPGQFKHFFDELNVVNIELSKILNVGLFSIPITFIMIGGSLFIIGNLICCLSTSSSPSKKNFNFDVSAFEERELAALKILTSLRDQRKKEKEAFKEKISFTPLIETIEVFIKEHTHLKGALDFKRIESKIDAT